MDQRVLSLAQEAADELQVPLEDVLTVMSYETGGTMDPMQKGPTTQWGQHEGYIQFGEPQAKQYGADFSSRDAAINSQLGAEGAFVKYMKGSGFIPGQHSGIDIYSTINAGAPNRYSASDANNGGAAGDVRDKWENQMDGHRAKARGWIEQGGLPLGPTQARANAGLPLNTRTPPEPEEDRYDNRLGRMLGLQRGGKRDQLQSKLGINAKQSDRLGSAISQIGLNIGR